MRSGMPMEYSVLYSLFTRLDIPFNPRREKEIQLRAYLLKARPSLSRYVGYSFRDWFAGPHDTRLSNHIQLHISGLEPVMMGWVVVDTWDAEYGRELARLDVRRLYRVATAHALATRFGTLDIDSIRVLWTRHIDRYVVERSVEEGLEMLRSWVERGYIPSPQPHTQRLKTI